MHTFEVAPSPGRTQRTEATLLTNELSVSVPSAPVTPAKNTTKREENRANGEDQVVLDLTRALPFEDVQSLPCTERKPFTMRWLERDGSIHCISLSRERIGRLKSSYAYSEDSFFSYLRNYVKRKYMSCEMARFPFMLPDGFYVLCKEVMDLDYELFSDALSQSGVLAHYCSEDPEDVVFGSEGTLRDNEEGIAGGVGIIPYGEEFLTKTMFKKLDAKMRSGKEYCRVFLIPIEQKGKLFEMFYDEEFLGELVCLIPAYYIRFLRRNIDIFRDGCDSDEDTSWKPPWKLAIVI